MFKRGSKSGGMSGSGGKFDSPDRRADGSLCSEARENVLCTYGIAGHKEAEQ